MRSTVHINVGEGLDPFTEITTRPARARVKGLIDVLKAIIGGGIMTRASSRPTVTVGVIRAQAIVTAATVVNANTVTLNGTALTATQHNSRGTVTAASVSVADTVTVNGVVFTAAAAENLATGAFDQSGTDTACATSLTACIMASTSALLSGIVTATSAAAVVTIRAATGGTGGDAITLATSNNTRLAKSGTTLTGGATVAANQFDFGGAAALNNVQTATALVNAVHASTTALISNNLQAANKAGIFVLASVAAGEWVSIDGVRFTAVSKSATAVAPGEFSIVGTDTQDGDALVTAIAATAALKGKVVATNASGTVTIRQLPPSPSTDYVLAKSGAGITLTAMTAVSAVLIASKLKGTSGNQATIASSGSTLAITGSVSRLAGGTDSTLTF